MSITPTADSASYAQASLLGQLLDRTDSNKDGKISRDEFGDFLAGVLKGLTALSDDEDDELSVRTLGETSDAPEVPPSQWTDCNAYDGVTFAGWSPQNFTMLTAADLAKPGKEKYALYSYLRANKIDPESTDWAPRVAAAMNRKYNTDVFRAEGGQTIRYYNQAVRTTPNGYGMQQGTFNPNARTQFFWYIAE
jgi:hypothetical protein